MKFIEPFVEFVRQTDKLEHLAKCARICYASQKEGNNEKLKENLIKNGHLSMFRHITYYFIVPVGNFDRSNIAKVRMFLRKYEKCPYIHIVTTPAKIYISTNGQFIYENKEFNEIFGAYVVSENQFKDTTYSSAQLENIRYTFFVTTQISTSRELNRVSPNNIAEQSTRYVKFKEGIGVAKPHWYDRLARIDKFIAKFAWRVAERAYNYFLNKGLLPQDAREFLPLCSYTKCAYTYTVKEWRHILDLRYYGTTGKPHPNAHYIASEIRELLINQGVTFED